MRAFELGTVYGQGDGFVAVGYPDVRREPAAKLLVADAVLFTGGCGNRYQDGTMLVLLNDTDAADSDGKSLVERSVTCPDLNLKIRLEIFLPSKVILSLRRTGQ